MILQLQFCYLKIKPTRKNSWRTGHRSPAPKKCIHTTELVTVTMPTDHKAKQRQKLGWFRFPRKLETAFSAFPIWQFSAKLIKTVKEVLKVTQCPIKLIH